MVWSLQSATRLRLGKSGSSGMMLRASRVIALWALLLGIAVSAGSAAVALEGSPFASVVHERSENEAKTPSQGNQVAMVSRGYDALLLRVHLIRHATKSINIQTFIWTNDEVGRLLIAELIEAARRGVKVRIIADHMFSDRDPDTVAFLASVHPNFEVRHYRPATSRLKPSFWRTALASVRSFHDVNQRMHSKVMIIDDAVLITGGRNIENTYYDHSTGLNFRDRDVVVVGPVVKGAVEEFEQFWKFRHTVKSQDLVDVSAALEKNAFKRFDHRDDFHFGGYFVSLDKQADDPALIETRFRQRLRPVEQAAFLFDSPGKSKKTSAQTARITQELSAVLHSAKRTLVIQTPYLVLSSTARALFLELRQRSPAVEIRVSTNSFASTDNLFAYSANYRLRNDYVEGLGLDVHELKPKPGELLTIFPTYSQICDAADVKNRAMGTTDRPFLSLHAKSMVIDDTIAFVGSYNLDPRSENLNTEVGLLVIDSAFARELREEIERDMEPENSWVIARRRFPLRLEAVNSIVDSVLSISPVDLWPVQNSSSFDLNPGASPVSPRDPSFYERYHEVGSFPGADGALSQKEIVTRLFKAVGSPLTPIL